MRQMANQLLQAARECGGSLAVTTSRRTGKQNEAILREGLNGVPLLFWDGKGENPYLGFLALADAIVVTDNSVSMVSEACAGRASLSTASFSERDRRNWGGFTRR